MWEHQQEEHTSLFSCYFCPSFLSRSTHRVAGAFACCACRAQVSCIIPRIYDGLASYCILPFLHHQNVLPLYHLIVIFIVLWSRVCMSIHPSSSGMSTVEKDTSTMCAAAAGDTPSMPPTQKLQVLPLYVHIYTAVPGTYTTHHVCELGQQRNGESFLKSYLVSHCKLGYDFFKNYVGKNSSKRRVLKLEIRQKNWANTSRKAHSLWLAKQPKWDPGDRHEIF